MGRYADKLRQIIKGIPTTSKGFTPEIASMCLARLANGSLQIISQLEESMEDLEKENTRLIEMLMEAGIGNKEWTP